MFRNARIVIAAMSILTVGATPAFACGGLVNPNGTVSLVRTTTMVGYVDGIEHYVTSFEFAGGGAEFGSIVPLPGIPSDVQRAGDWTLQRLVKEVTPPVRARGVALLAGGADAEMAEVIYETRIDALDITILKGGGDAVGEWAEKNGFELTPDAPEILDFYAERSPIFMAARFDPAAAREAEQQVGDGTPIHLTIPTPNPWVPLRILTLGLPEGATVDADLFLLTENVPEMLPAPTVGQGEGLILERSERASLDLLQDLRSDKGMDWIPADDMWLSFIRINADVSDLRHDLAIDATGVGEPSPVAAGLEIPVPELPGFPRVPYPVWAWIAGAIALWGAIAFRNRPTS